MMDHEQIDCLGMTRSLWVPYQHGHILKGRLFGRVDGRECAWCDCFFGWCMFYGWAVVTGDEPHVPVAHPDSYFIIRDYMGLTNSRFLSTCAFCLGTSRQCQETESRFTERIGTMRNIDISDQGKLFFTWSCTLFHYNTTQLQLCAPLFAQNRFVMYISHCIGTFVMYVTCYIYIISFLCEVMGATSPEEGKKEKMLWYSMIWKKVSTWNCYVYNKQFWNLAFPNIDHM